MEIATLVCNQKLSYDSVFQSYSMYEYLRKQENQVQIIDYNLLNKKRNKKNIMLYNFLYNNTILTVNRYNSLEQIEDNQPLVDRYIIINGSYNELTLKLNGKDNIAYGVKDLDNSEMKELSKNFSNISSIYDIKNDDIPKVVDPIFLLSKEEWSDIILDKSSIKLSQEYNLIYSDYVTKDMLKYASIISQKNNCKNYIVSEKTEGLFYNGKRLKNVNPIELANLIFEAQEVITSCNDGIKLSVLFDKDLHIFISKEEEQIELINELKVQSRIVNNPEIILPRKEDYEKSKKMILGLKEKSCELLK